MPLVEVRPLRFEEEEAHAHLLREAGLLLRDGDQLEDNQLEDNQLEDNHSVHRHSEWRAVDPRSRQEAATVHPVKECRVEVDRKEDSDHRPTNKLVVVAGLR